MSAPEKRICPESGAVSPASWPIRVVLPAPFGPITACSSPSGMSSEMWSDGMTPPKRLVKPSIRSRGSATTDLRFQRFRRRQTGENRYVEQPVDAAAGKQDDEQQQGTENDLPVFGDAGERFLQDQQGHGADQGAERRGHPAEHHHADQVARPRPVHP